MISLFIEMDYSFLIWTLIVLARRPVFLVKCDISVEATWHACLVADRVAWHSCLLVEFNTILASGGHPRRFYLLYIIKFIAWCSRCPDIGMPKWERIFASALHGFSLMQGPHHKTALCHISTWWSVVWILVKLATNIPLFAHHCTSCKINPFHCKLWFELLFQ